MQNKEKYFELLTIFTFIFHEIFNNIHFIFLHNFFRIAGNSFPYGMERDILKHLKTIR